MDKNQVYNMDCLEGMQGIANKSIDMILCDLPYGTTSCKWDVIIPFEPLWKQYERIIKDNGAIVLFSSQPFTTKLISSNFSAYKYDWYWKKKQGVNFQLVRKQPLKNVEIASVFYKQQPTYNPQGIIKLNAPIRKSNKNKGGKLGHLSSEEKREYYLQEYTNYPCHVLEFEQERGLHPTQKPVALFEYLIKTYTNEGETVLDNCMGSFTTAIACINTNRNFIGFEWSPVAPHDQYYNIGMERIKKHTQQLKLI